MTTEKQHQLFKTIEEAVSFLPDISFSFRKKSGTMMIYIAEKPVAAFLDEGLAIKLQEDDRLALLQEPGAAPFQRSGEPAGKQYVIVPDHISEDAKQLGAWLERSATFVGGFISPKKKDYTRKPGR